MIRKTYTLDEEHHNKITKDAKSRKISNSEVIRDIIDLHYEEPPKYPSSHPGYTRLTDLFDTTQDYNVYVTSPLINKPTACIHFGVIPKTKLKDTHIFVTEWKPLYKALGYRQLTYLPNKNEDCLAEILYIDIIKDIKQAGFEWLFNLLSEQKVTPIALRSIKEDSEILNIPLGVVFKSEKGAKNFMLECCQITGTGFNELYLVGRRIIPFL